VRDFCDSGEKVSTHRGMKEDRLSIAATFTSEPIGRWLEWWLARVGCCVEVTFAAYGQLERELRSPLAFRGAVSCIGLLRLSDWHRDDAFDASIMQAALDTFTDSVRVALANLPRLCLVLCPSRPSAHAAQYEVAAARLCALAAQEPRLCVIDASVAASSYGVLDVHDAVADELGHVPYAEPMWCALGAATARGCLAALAPPLKLIVVDCDYTLWHHAVGEVGAAGVRFEARHLELHRRLLELRSRGVLLALASRNVEADVWAALETAPASAPETAPATAPATALGEPSRLDERPPGVEAMAATLAGGAVATTPPPVAPPPVAPPPVGVTSELRRFSRQHLSAYRIAPSLHKGAAVAALCAELRCGPESCLFIDDNPSEVAAVRAALPSCACWCACRICMHLSAHHGALPACLHAFECACWCACRICMHLNAHHGALAASLHLSAHHGALAACMHASECSPRRPGGKHAFECPSRRPTGKHACI
jgi:HAD superfamily phosphatase (TIGR01681 family)